MPRARAVAKTTSKHGDGEREHVGGEAEAEEAEEEEEEDEMGASAPERRTPQSRSSAAQRSILKWTRNAN